jgi:hypothetical protein
MKLITSALGPLPVLGIAATTLAFGFGAGRLSVPSSPATQPTQAPAVAEKQEIRTLPAVSSPVAPDANAVSAKKPGKEDIMKILENPDARGRGNEIDALLAKADESEVKQILDWVTAMPDSAAKRVALGKVMKKWGELDGAAASAYGVDAFQQTGNSSLLRNALLGWAQADPSSSMQYLQGLGLGRGLSNDFSRDILGVWSNANPQAAASYLEANPSVAGTFGGFGRRGGGGPFGSASSIVAGNWAAQDPQAAASWALSLPSGPQQGSAMNQVLQNWVNQDPNGAVAFVNSQAAGPARDGMVSSLARSLAADDPASAMKWVGSIGNQGMQMGTVMGVLGEAGVFSPNGPDTTLAQSLVSTLPQNVQQQVMQRLTNRGGGGGRGGNRAGGGQ